jgi:DNA polymerase-3 subunit delta'
MAVWDDVIGQPRVVAELAAAAADADALVGAENTVQGPYTTERPHPSSELSDAEGRRRSAAGEAAPTGPPPRTASPGGAGTPPAPPEPPEPPNPQEPPAPPARPAARGHG